MSDTAVDAIRFLRDTAIAANTDIGSRIYMSIAPQSATFPLAVMEIVSRVPTPTQDSGSAIDTYRVQVDVYAKGTTGFSGFETAHTVASELRTAWSRTTDEFSYDNAISGVQEQGHFTDFDSELQVFRVSNDYLIRVTPEGTVMTQIIKRTKITKTYADFSAAATSNSIVSGFDLPIKGLVHTIFINPTIGFSGGSLFSYSMSVGYSGNNAIWLTNKPINTTGSYSSSTFGNAPGSSLAAITPVLLTATSSGANLNAATAGSVDIWIYYSILD